jgi:hypothetical protein
MGQSNNVDFKKKVSTYVEDSSDLAAQWHYEIDEMNVRVGGGKRNG